MRAIVQEEFGPPEVLRAADVPEPVPGEGQVLIEVTVAAVVYIDVQLRSGRTPHPAMVPALPRTPGNGVAGRVLSVGTGVDADLIGRGVVATTGGSGGYAEKVLAAATDLVPIPEALDDRTAAALLADGRTALGLHRATAPQQGEWVLVEAAAGGLGSLLVQLARTAGARVIGAAGSAEKLRLIEELGAEAVVDYTDPDWPDQVRRTTGGTGPDVVYDGVGGAIGRAAFGLVRDGGRFCVHGAASGEDTSPPEDEVAARGLRIVGLDEVGSSPEEFRWLIEQALDEGAAGRLRPTIGQVFTLDRAADAHAAIEDRRAVGKTLLVPDQGTGPI